MPNQLGQNRYGFMVSKRLGNAVTRNKVKRRLREVVRLAELERGWDAVFIARRGAEKADYHELEQAAHVLLKRANLFPARSQRTSPE